MARAFGMTPFESIFDFSQRSRRPAPRCESRSKPFFLRIQFSKNL